MSYLNRFWNKIKLWFLLVRNSLFRGMKSADDLISNGNKTALDNGVDAEERLEEKNVYKNLLKGEITQEVKDLRYETYQAYQKSMDYQYVGGGQAKKKNNMLTVHKETIENSNNLDIVIVQRNFEVYDDMLSTLEDKNIDREPLHTIKLKRNTHPRFLLENYTHLLAVKKTDIENQFEVDFYVYSGPKDNNPKDIYFIKEMEGFYKSKSKTSEIIDFEELEFVSSKSWPVDDNLEFHFKNFKFQKVIKYKDSYIIRFLANGNTPINLIEEFNDPIAVEKFNKKTPRKGNKTAIKLSDAKDIVEFNDQKEAFDEDKAKEIVKKISKKKTTKDGNTKKTTRKKKTTAKPKKSAKPKKKVRNSD